MILVSLRSLGDLLGCLPCLARGTHEDFSVVVVENGGAEAAAGLEEALLEARVVARGSEGLALVPGGQKLRILPAADNLGYAGGVNAGLEAAGACDAYWVLNPDTFPEPEALAALLRRQAEGGYGMVGSRLVFARSGRVHCRGGLAWHPWLYRGRLLGFGEDGDAPAEEEAVEARLDVVSGASMLVTRDYVATVGGMDARLFLFGEDVDWCLRRGAFRLGYAHGSVVRHVHGAATGASAENKASRGRLAVCLAARNAVLVARRHSGTRFPVVAALRFLQGFEELLRHRSWRHFLWAQQGFFAGLRGEGGRPGWLR